MKEAQSDKHLILKTKMWNMMCDVMPTIAEDNISQRSSQFSGDDANFEQLMVSMLDERDKLMDSLREAQERLGDAEVKLTDTEKERDSLQRQINANLPQVNEFHCTISYVSSFYKDKLKNERNPKCQTLDCNNNYLSPLNVECSISEDNIDKGR